MKQWFILSGVMSLLVFGVSGCGPQENGSSGSEGSAEGAPANEEQSAGTTGETAAAEAAAAETGTQTEKEEAAVNEATNGKEVAVITTSKGKMIAEFWPEVAPKTVENFKKLAREGFYDGTAFHRIIKGFMIQGGDPLTKDPSKESAWGTGGPGYQIDAEFNDRKHVRGVLSMARSRDPNSAGSQFFIVLDEAPHLDGQYTGFGKLIDGEDVLMEIGNAPTVMGSDGSPSKPTERIDVQSIEIVPASEAGVSQ